MNTKELNLDFPTTTKEEWIKKIEADLKGKTVDSLYWDLSETLKIPPLAVKEDLAELPHLQDQFAQDILSSITASYYINEQFHLNTLSNAVLKEALETDVQSFEFIIKNIEEIDALQAFLDFLDGKEKVKKIIFSASTNELLKQLTEKEWCVRFVETHREIEFLFAFNFFSEWVLSGEFSLTPEYIKTLHKQFKKHVRFLRINANYFHNAGASVEQELAYALSQASSYFSFFDTPEELVSRIDFLFSIGSYYFVEIAKLRAFRILWGKLIKLNSPDFSSLQDIQLSAITSEWNKAIFDPYLNMLRNTTETMSAIVGGADTITVLPFDYFYKKPDSFSRRMARNVHHILNQEAHLTVVNDPAKGAYYVEILTHLIGKAAWEQWQEIEKAGGFEQSWEAGIIKQAIEQHTQKVKTDFAKRKKVVVGVNNYPNLTEEMVPLLETTLVDSNNNKGLKQFRIAEELEQIRLENERLFSQKPKAFLLTYGNVAMRRARAGFALNFLGCAGFEIIDNLGFDSLDEAIAEYKKSGASIVVACSADDDYEVYVPELFEQVDGIKIVAGKPTEKLQQTKTDYFIYTGVDIISTLKQISIDLQTKK